MVAAVVLSPSQELEIDRNPIHGLCDLFRNPYNPRAETWPLGPKGEGQKLKSADHHMSMHDHWEQCNRSSSPVVKLQRRRGDILYSEVRGNQAGGAQAKVEVEVIEPT